MEPWSKLNGAVSGVSGVSQRCGRWSVDKHLVLWKRAEGSIWYHMPVKAKHAQDLLKSEPVEWGSYAAMKYRRVINQKALILQPLSSSQPLAICAMATWEAWTWEGTYLPWLHCRNMHAVFTLDWLMECVVFSSWHRFRLPFASFQMTRRAI